MEFTIQKSDFLNALNLVKLALPTKAPKAILKSVFVTVEKGFLELRATDETIYISCKLPVNAKGNAQFCIDGLVTDLIPKLNDTDVKFKLTDKKLTISQGKRKHDFSLLDHNGFPEKIEVDNFQEIEVDHLLGALKRVYFVTKGGDKEYYHHFNFSDNYVIGGDGLRVVRVKGVNVSENITLNAKAIMDVLQYISDLSTIEVSFNSSPLPSALRGSTNNMTFEAIYSAFNEDYPSNANKAVETLLNSSFGYRVVFNKSQFKNMLDVCCTCANQAKNSNAKVYVNVSNNGTGIKFDVSIPDVTEFEDVLEPVEKEGENLQAIFDPINLTEMINTIQAENVELRFFNSDAKKPLPIMVLDPLNPNLTYIQATPIRN